MYTAHPTLDSILGPAKGRYFGSRYAHVIPTIQELGDWLSVSENHTATGAAKIEIRGSWSKKGTRTAVPHLGTIDVMSLALQATEGALARFAGAIAWRVASVGVKAPAAPVESGFESIPLAISFWHQLSSASAEVAVAGFTVAVKLEAEGPRPHQASKGRSVYRDVYRARVPQIGPVELGIGHARSTANIIPTGQWAHSALLDASKAESLNVIDAFVTVLQLGQVLLYKLDDLSRADSHILWMRSTRIEARPGATDVSDVSVILEGPRLRTLRNDPWRLATITGSLGDLFKISCAVAHRLPQNAQSSQGGVR